MIREEKIKEAAMDYASYLDGTDQEYDKSLFDAFKDGAGWADRHPEKKQSIEEINAFIKELQPNEGQISDGYHTFDELYDFRRAYNAALVNTHVYPCHKSLRHSDGELCFGGGWFIVMINLPTGQISNHYETKYWDEFNCEERECAEPWDGHTEKDVVEFANNLLKAFNDDMNGDVVVSPPYICLSEKGAVFHDGEVRRKE